MALYCAQGASNCELSSEQLQNLLFAVLDKLGKRERVLAIPPDQTRASSGAGELTRLAWRRYGESLHAVLPALGTHKAMSTRRIAEMFGEMPANLFHAHNWRRDTATIGVVPREFILEQSEGQLDFDWPAQVNRFVVDGGFDLVLSFGQVVPHEVAGMANYNKNILVGTGGPDSINRSHYLGAVYGLERIMGHADNPVRRVLNHAASHFLQNVPIVYVLTVVSRNEAGSPVIRGLFVGDDDECFRRAADLSLQVNLELVPQPISKIVVYLNPEEFHSTWLGNKAIYRTRMALADGGELVILAPGVNCFGEDPVIDSLIRRYGYRGTGATLQMVRDHPDLAKDLSAPAHLIHGSTEGRFQITYCAGKLSRVEVESVGFKYGDLDRMTQRYDPSNLRPGWNRVGGEDFFFVEHPGLGLWASSERFRYSGASIATEKLLSSAE